MNARFAVYAVCNGYFTLATPWCLTRDEAEQHADLHTDLGLTGNAVGCMGVYLDGRIYIDMSTPETYRAMGVRRFEITPPPEEPKP